MFIRKQDARAILERHEKTVPAEIAGVLRKQRALFRGSASGKNSEQLSALEAELHEAGEQTLRSIGCMHDEPLNGRDRPRRDRLRPRVLQRQCRSESSGYRPATRGACPSQEKGADNCRVSMAIVVFYIPPTEASQQFHNLLILLPTIWKRRLKVRHLCADTINGQVSRIGMSRRRGALVT